MKSLLKPKVIKFIAAVSCFLASFAYAQEDLIFSRQEKAKEARGYHASGKLLLEQGNYEAANAQFKKAQGLLSQEPPPAADSAAALPQASGALQETSAAQMAFEAAQQGLQEKAITLYLRAIDTSPQDASLYYNLGLEYLKIKRFGDAGKAFKRVTQLNPRDKDAYYNLAVLYESYLNDKRQALNYYAQYLKNAPQASNAIQIKEWMGQIKKELKGQ